jgi:hypothetical protein
MSGIIRSCDATSDGCSDADCRYCYGGEREAPERLRRLAHNLAVAGALTESWCLGDEHGSSPRAMRDLEWWPGCGKAAGV